MTDGSPNDLTSNPVYVETLCDSPTLGKRGMYNEWGSWVSLAVESKPYHYLEEGIVSSSISNSMH